MSKTDWIEVGLRLLGVYFFINGLLALLGVILVMARVPSPRLSDVDPGAEIFLVPLTQTAAGVLLLFLKWPRVEESSAQGHSTPRRVAPVPAHLQESLERMEGENSGRQP